MGRKYFYRGKRRVNRNNAMLTVKIPAYLMQEIELSLWDLDLMTKQDYLLGILGEALGVQTDLLPLGYR